MRLLSDLVAVVVPTVEVPTIVVPAVEVPAVEVPTIVVLVFSAGVVTQVLKSWSSVLSALSKISSAAASIA